MLTDAARAARTVTGTVVATEESNTDLTVMVARPTVTAVTTPVAETVATAALSER
ncbi:MAG: hypothetical protein P3B76_00385 [Gemmatimonadota bacterium]|nr:hypothetical protein [Gemmatimonadota bacterium]MDQ8167323.1 hypothetical protein [Gemmatimonadota bacterium]MDQ8171115.1 hypothetical protein [Gemmatimonadota bacterium]